MQKKLVPPNSSFDPVDVWQLLRQTPYLGVQNSYWIWTSAPSHDCATRDGVDEPTKPPQISFCPFQVHGCLHYSFRVPRS